MSKMCPNCNVQLVESYWDTVEEQEDGSFILDSFEAFVCMNRCGYFERLI
ncbi:hypothetical protein [Fredinandcohnia sp. 179-A 10B2 NHS]